MSLTEFFLTREIGSEEIKKVSRNRGWRPVTGAAVYKLAWGMGLLRGESALWSLLCLRVVPTVPTIPDLSPAMSLVSGE